MVLSLTQDGANKVNEMLQGMASLKGKVGAIAQQILHLSEQTSQIGSITAMVTDFANETKMLAMNAAVEAVRAGEHGKGFSVLSVEIRKLADESKRSADRINALVVDVQKATNATVMATEEGTKTVDAGIELTQSTAATFDSVAAAVGSASESAQQISLNVAQQAEAVKQVVEAMNALKISSKESASGIAQTKVGIQTLNEAAQQLKSMV
jgi:methyl-accepting chemotaxis protein